MNQRDRAELFDALAELRRRYPDWRLGQLVSNVAGWADQSVWDIEDDQLLAAAEKHLQALAPQKREVHTQMPAQMKQRRLCERILHICRQAIETKASQA